ncbi:paralemmin-2 [Periophthalmus magnuspinnatus]|uniref:paralemmin-2 n=1 Tax=Periophthalmus magnuspinnatus TaxID=409849 RepID=UPI0024370394|nr:paralemmin-2 [Periophthalmus magnuspinnatus]
MKKRSKDRAETIPLSSPTGSGGVQVDHDFQKVAFKSFAGNGHAADHKPSESPNAKLKDQHLQDDNYKNSPWVLETSSQAEDNSTDPPETMTETSTLTFVDAQILEENVPCAGGVYFKEFVLIDDEDDGDMSLREKTVTDISVMDGRAAELVCGRIVSTSSGSLTESKEEMPVSPETPPAEQTQIIHARSHCCHCAIL